jgi:hypothetical protein
MEPVCLTGVARWRRQSPRSERKRVHRECLIEHFVDLFLSTRSIGHGLFDADDLGIYRTYAGVEECVDALKAAGFRNTDISVLFPRKCGNGDLHFVTLF